MDEEKWIEKDLHCQASVNKEISRREALKSSALVLGACYIAPTTMNLLLTDSAAAQVNSLPPERETFNSEFRVCNFMLSESHTVSVEYIDMFGPDSRTIPGGHDPNEGVSAFFDDLLDGGELTVSTSVPAYYTFMSLADTKSLQSFISAGDDKRVHSLMNALSNDDGKISTLTMTLDNESQSLVITLEPPS